MKSFIGKPEDELTPEQMHEALEVSKEMANTDLEFENYMSDITKKNYNIAKNYYMAADNKEKALTDLKDITSDMYIDLQYEMNMNDLYYNDQINIYGEPLCPPYDE